MAILIPAPKSIKVPEYSFTISDEEVEANELKYLTELKAWCLSQSKERPKEVGEIIRFQIADGYAQYMVIDLNPAKLVLVSLCDAYEFPYIHRLTTKDILNEIERNRLWDKLISEK